MRHLLLAGLLAATPFCHAAEQTRTVPEFKTITSKGFFKLVVEVGPAQSLKLKGDDRALAQVTTEVVGDELVLRSKDRDRDRRSHNDEDTVTVTITMPLLKQFQMEGAGMTELNHISGDRFELVYRGAGMLTANGKVDNFVLRAEGVGSLDAKNLSARQANVALNGVGSVKVRASESLTAAVNGIGSLTYYGRPAQLTKAVGGIGSVSAGE